MSPIKNLTERRRLPRIGKIHLGILADKNKEGKPCTPYPKAVDYFVFSKEHSQYEEIVKAFGEKPRELRIIFPLEDEERFASQYYRCYSKTRGLICKGDGETAMRMIDTQTGALADRNSKAVVMKDIPCQGRKCPDYGTKCKELMNLQFMLPEISGLGIWQIDTSSVNSIMRINGALDLIRAVYGRVRMVPLILSLEQIEVTNPDDGKKKKVWVMNLLSTDKMIEAAIKSRMEPMQLIAGIGEAEELDDVDVPVPDEERPAMVTSDWEGPAGEPIKHPMSQEESLNLAEKIWPPEELTEPAEQQPEVAQGKEPATIQELLTWISGHGKQYTKSWMLKNFSYTEIELKKPEKVKDAYHEIKGQMSDWTN